MNKFSFLVVVFMLLALSGLLIAPIQTAGAAYWSVNSQFDCYTGSGQMIVVGDSWLDWDGYGSSAWGATAGTLWWWTGSSWRPMASGYDDHTGSPGIAIVTNRKQYAPAGWWDETGGHTSNFFSGQRNSDSGSRYCAP